MQAVFASVVSCDLTVALVQHIGHGLFALCRLAQHRTPTETAWVPWLIVGTILCYELQCPLLNMQSSRLLCKENGFIIENRLLIFSYRHSSACKYQVGIALDYIVFECLTLKIAVWVADSNFIKKKKNHEMKWILAWGWDRLSTSLWSGPQYTSAILS